jgi:hypothetical protein
VFVTLQDLCGTVNVDTAPGTTQVQTMPFERERMKQMAATLAARGVYIGTSSWEYEG